MSENLSGEAEALMNNEAFVSALNSARQQCITAAMGCGVADDEGRRRYLDAAKNVDKIRGHLVALIQSAKTGESVDPANFYEERAKRRFAFFNKD